MKKERLLIVVSLMVVLSTLIVACGAPAETTEAPAAEESAAEEPAAEEPAAAEPVTVDVWFHSGKGEERDVLDAQVTAFNEMQDKGAGAICCGNVAWTGCDAYSKALQVKRLRQAHDTESDILVTACPKCQIHLRCAMEDPFRGDELKMDMVDLTSMLAKTIQWE